MNKAKSQILSIESQLYTKAPARSRVQLLYPALHEQDRCFNWFIVLPTREFHHFEGNSSVHSIAALYNSTVSSLPSCGYLGNFFEDTTSLRAVDAFQPRLSSSLEANLRASFESFDAVLAHTVATIINCVHVSIIFLRLQACLGE